LIEAIKTAAETVVPTLNSELPQSLRRRLEDWCELHGFDSLERTAVQTIIARQALLSVLLQAALYERQWKQHAWPRLDTDPQTALDHLTEQIGHTGFEACVLDDVVQLFEATDLEAVLGERHRVLYSSQPTEAIGGLYEALLPSEYRRTIGQHRTPPEIGNLMQTWATSGGDAVLDPGMGAGGLSTPFHPRWDVSTDPGDVTGIDRSPIAACMGITAQTLARQATSAQLTDFLDITPEELEKRLDEIFGGGGEAAESFEEQSPLSNLESVVLTLDWEISDEAVSSFLSEVESLRSSSSGDKLQENFLKILHSLGKYIQRRKEQADPEALNLLQTVFADLKKSAGSEELSRTEKKDLLRKDIEQYNVLKSRISQGKASRSADHGQEYRREASPDSGREEKDAAAVEKESQHLAGSLERSEEEPTVELGTQPSQSGDAQNKTVFDAIEELKEVIREEFRQLRKDLGVQKSGK